MEDYIRQICIHDWMGIKEKYDSGVTNEEVLERFGSEYVSAWKKLKKNKKLLFFENGKWYRWNK